MATSGVRDQATTVLSIITQALRKLRIGVAGETLSAEDTSIGIDALRGMVRTWAVDGVRLWLVETQSQTLVSGTADYTLSPRPLEVLRGYRRASGNDTPMRMLGREEFTRLPNKTTSGAPYSFYANDARTSTTVTLYPVPGAAEVAASMTCRFDVKRQIEDVTALGEDTEIPAEWIECIVYNLAVRLAPDYGKQAAPDVTSMADGLYGLLSGHDRENSVIMRAGRRR